MASGGGPDVLIYKVLLALFLAAAVVTGSLLYVAAKSSRRRWLLLLGAAVCLATTVAVTAVWLHAPRVGGNSCGMDALSEFLDSTADDPTCAHEGRVRVALSGTMELVVLLGGAWLARSLTRR